MLVGLPVDAVDAGDAGENDDAVDDVEVVVTASLVVAVLPLVLVAVSALGFTSGE